MNNVEFLDRFKLSCNMIETSWGMWEHSEPLTQVFAMTLVACFVTSSAVRDTAEAAGANLGHDLGPAPPPPCRPVGLKHGGCVEHALSTIDRMGLQQDRSDMLHRRVQIHALCERRRHQS